MEIFISHYISLCVYDLTMSWFYLDFSLFFHSQVSEWELCITARRGQWEHILWISTVAAQTLHWLYKEPARGQQGEAFISFMCTLASGLFMRPECRWIYCIIYALGLAFILYLLRRPKARFHVRIWIWPQGCATDMINNPGPCFSLVLLINLCTSQILVINMQPTRTQSSFANHCFYSIYYGWPGGNLKQSLKTNIHRFSVNQRDTTLSDRLRTFPFPQSICRTGIVCIQLFLCSLLGVLLCFLLHYHHHLE